MSSTDFLGLSIGTQGRKDLHTHCTRLQIMTHSDVLSRRQTDESALANACDTHDRDVKVLSRSTHVVSFSRMEH